MMRDDRDAQKRRINFRRRISGLKTDVEILKGLGLKNPYGYPIFHFVAGTCAQCLPYGLYKNLRNLFDRLYRNRSGR